MPAAKAEPAAKARAAAKSAAAKLADTAKAAAVKPPAAPQQAPATPGGVPVIHIHDDALLICGGVYGNKQALHALLEVARAEGIAPRQMIFTGDLAAYCADGAAVAEHCRRALAAALFIRGNCERALAADEDDCGCGFAAGSTCSLLSVAWYRHARRTISAQNKRWFGALPPLAQVYFGGRRFAVIHGGSKADNTFLFPSTPTPEKHQHLQTLSQNLAAAEQTPPPPLAGVIAGHSGIPFTQRLEGGAIWHNSGALGMPANDGTPRVWYSIWRYKRPSNAAGAGESGKIEIHHRALAYDTAAAAASMEAAGLPPDYRQTLSSGIWCSDSILPPPERQNQGTPLAESTLQI